MPEHFTEQGPRDLSGDLSQIDSSLNLFNDGGGIVGEVQFARGNIIHKYGENTGGWPADVLRAFNTFVVATALSAESSRPLADQS